MSRLARVVVPGFPHHVTQRGNRRRPIFFEDRYTLYRGLLAQRCRTASVEVWAYCLMPNHVHVIMVPQSADGACRRRNAPAIHRVRQCACPVDRDAAAVARLRAAESTGRPLGSDEFVARLEQRLRRTLQGQKPGRKARADNQHSGIV
jgi:REP element-mobilizing transposase RayT